MKVTANTTIVVGKGEDHPPGTVVDIDDAEAQDLLARGLVSEAADAPVAEQKPQRPRARAQFLVAVKEAIETLDLENEENVTRDGKPSVAAIEKILGYDITATERDEVWGTLV